MEESTMWGIVQIKKKRGWGDPQAWKTAVQQGGGGWGQKGNSLGEIISQYAGFLGGPGGNPDVWGNQLSGKDWVQNQKIQQKFEIKDINKIDITKMMEYQIIQMEPSPAKKDIKKVMS